MSSPKKVRVMIVDDQPSVRESIRSFLETLPEFELAGEASNGYDAISLSGYLQPDLLLLDVLMPKVDGVNAARLIHQDHPHIDIIMMSESGDDELVCMALQDGARACLNKDFLIRQ